MILIRKIALLKKFIWGKKKNSIIIIFLKYKTKVIVKEFIPSNNTWVL